VRETLPILEFWVFFKECASLQKPIPFDRNLLSFAFLSRSFLVAYSGNRGYLCQELP